MTDGKETPEAKNEEKVNGSSKAPEKTNEDSKPAEAPTAEQKKKKKNLKIAGYVILALFLLFLVISFSLGSIVKTAVNAVLPKVTGTPCSMGSCFFNPIAGRITISDLKIGNPKGYAKENAFVLGNLTIDVGVGSLFSDKIVIEEIAVKGMNVDFEVKMTETNLTQLKKNIDEFTKTDEATQKAPKETPEDKTQEKTEKSGPAKKLQINLIEFSDNSMSTGATGKVVTIPFADMRITDIGKGPGGATVGEISSKILSAINEAVARTAKDNGWKSVKNGTGKAIDTVKGWFGGGDKKEK